ncbi:hypothetical protein SynA1825c_02420 [Synechococcus sp. A18-25c]|uniref:hypothetical protein n=1 Tax=unclassified Synechococcus TaxID=2626047 RepID=UPI001647F0FB|nr:MULTISPECIES: hypothetical protein [unclassified Synechococcus]QNI49109.1 hypothetical protein SynA1560_02467 [Synechococcus sp. A15-60]QNJ20711.1 hypothetical protein SynA1825c_02420 [Synechococcus sp. A18-25c]
MAAVVRSCLAVLLLLVGASPSVEAFEDCSLITRMMNSIGASMARNRMFIAASQETGENREQADAASAQLSRQSRDFRELREDYVRNKCGNAWD